MDYGKVYVYKNTGPPLNFSLSVILQANDKLSGLFGATLSKVGDLNRDGFNGIFSFSLNIFYFSYP